MAFAQELTKILNLPDSGVCPAVLDVEESDDGRIAGFLISPKFAGMPQLDRQDLVWRYLESTIDRDKRSRILSLITVTPEENED